MQWLTFVAALLRVNCALYGPTSTTEGFRDCLLVQVDPVTGAQTSIGAAIPHCSVSGIQQAQRGPQNILHWLSYDLSANNSCHLVSSDLLSGRIVSQVAMPFYERQGFFGFAEMLAYNSNTQEVMCFGILPGQEQTERGVIAVNPTTGAWRSITSITIANDAGQASTFDPQTNQALFQVGMETDLVVKSVDVITGVVIDLPAWDIATMDYHEGDGRIYCSSFKDQVWGVASFSTKNKDWKYVGRMTPGGWLGINNQYSALDSKRGMLYVMLYNVTGAPVMYLVGVDIATAKEVTVTTLSSFPPPHALIAGKE